MLFWQGASVVLNFISEKPAEANVNLGIGGSNEQLFQALAATTPQQIA